MSKNLTVDGIEGIFVYTDYGENLYEWKAGEVSSSYGRLTGPAIDRLYEFEQLGMEPEEIEELEEENLKLKDENSKLKSKLETINNLSDLRTKKVVDDDMTAGPRH